MVYIKYLCRHFGLSLVQWLAELYSKRRMNSMKWCKNNSPAVGCVPFEAADVKNACYNYIIRRIHTGRLSNIPFSCAYFSAKEGKYSLVFSVLAVSIIYLSFFLQAVWLPAHFRELLLIYGTRPESLTPVAQVS